MVDQKSDLEENISGIKNFKNIDDSSDFAESKINSEKELEDLQELTRELEKFQKIRERVKSHIESTKKLLPKLRERKERLEEETFGIQEKVTEIDDLIPKLEEKKDSLQKEIQKKQVEIGTLGKAVKEKKKKIDEIDLLIPKLKANKRKISKTIEQKEREISTIQEQTRKISSLQNSLK